MISNGSIFDDNHISPFVIGQNQWREKEKKRIKKEWVVSKVVKKWFYKYYFSNRYVIIIGIIG